MGHDTAETETRNISRKAKDAKVGYLCRGVVWNPPLVHFGILSLWSMRSLRPILRVRIFYSVIVAHDTAPGIPNFPIKPLHEGALTLRIAISYCRCQCSSTLLDGMMAQWGIVTLTLWPTIAGFSDSERPPANAPRRQVRRGCHFDPGEKSLLDPSHSLGMTGTGPSP